MSKKISFIVLILSVLFCWCTKIDTNINYDIETELTWYEYSKLSYLLEWTIDLENDEADKWNKPLATDFQKWRFIFNILNNNFMDKYEAPEEVSNEPIYPVLSDTLIDNYWDMHDWVLANDRDVKVAYKKSDIDKFMNDAFWGTVKDWNTIQHGWLILSWDNYLFFNYKYYWSDLIWNKWRATRFEIENINQASDKDIEVTAKYHDDILFDWENFEEGICNLTYHISKNPWSFYWYRVNEYMYTWCEINPNYIWPDLPSQIIYWIDESIHSDYAIIQDPEVIVSKLIDIDGNWNDETFLIRRDSPNWIMLFWWVWNNGVNFVYDFSGDFLDEYDELKNGVFVEMYFEDLDWWDDKEILVAVWDKKTWSEVNIYKLWWENWFTRLWKINWDAYLYYDINSMTIHAPYSNHWVCQLYEVADWSVFKI